MHGPAAYSDLLGNILEDVKFQTFGCVAAIAVSSIVSEMAKGKKLEEALQITRQSVAQAWGATPEQDALLQPGSRCSGPGYQGLSG